MLGHVPLRGKETDKDNLCRVIFLLVIDANELVLMLLRENVLIVGAEHFNKKVLLQL